MSAGRATTEHGMGGVGIMRDARAVGAVRAVRDVRELASVRLTTRAREASGPGRGVRPGEG